MAQPQYYEVLNGVKNPEQHFFTNIEDSTVQYVITPDNTQVQFSNQQLTDKIIQTQIVQQPIIQQPIQIQTSQYALIKDGTIRTTEGQQIFFVENAVTDGIVIEKPIQHTHQPIVLNHQITQPAVVRSPLMKPVLNQQVSLEIIQKQKTMQRPPNPNQQVRQISPSIAQIRQQVGTLPNKTASPTITANVSQPQMRGQQIIRHGLVRTGQSTFRPQIGLVRQSEPNQVRQQIRMPNQTTHHRPNIIRSPNVSSSSTTQRMQAINQNQQVQQSSSQLTKFNNQGTNVSDSETKVTDEQDGVALPDGTVVTMISYKKMLAEQKTRSAPQKSNVGQQNTQLHQATTNLQQNTQVQTNNPIQTTNPIPSATHLVSQNSTTANASNRTPAASKKRTPSPRVPRSQQPKNPRNPRSRPNAQANQQLQQQQTSNQGHFSMLNQQQQTVNKPQVQQFSSQPPALAVLSQSHQQQQSQMQPQQQQANMQPQQQQQQTQMQPSQQQQALMQSPQQQQQSQLQPHQQSPSRGQVQQPQTQQLRSRPSQANYVIQPPKLNQKPANQRPLPSFVAASHIQRIIEETPLSEEFADSIRMLVMLDNGEQRLITFTLPKEACTIQEILEQVNVPFKPDTNIQVMETNSEGINYIVTVGNTSKSQFGIEDSPPPSQEASTPPQPPMQPQMQAQFQAQQAGVSSLSKGPAPKPVPPPIQQKPEAPSRSPSPEPAKEAPKFVADMLALCGACGYLSEDFNKCIRCGRKLPDTVKAIPATMRTGPEQKRDIAAVALAQQQKHQALQQQHQQQQQQQQSQPQAQQQQQKSILATAAQKAASPQKKKTSKSKSVEESVHVISSDEEEEESPKLSENLLQKLGSSVTISPKSKEPTLNDIQRHCPSKSDVPSKVNTEKHFVRTKVKCRTVRIGSYRCVPLEEIVVDSNAVTFKVPHPTKEKGIRTISFEKSDTVKVLVSFNSSLPVVFYYLNPSAAAQVRAALDMATDSDYYYDPLSLEDEAHRRLTLLPDDLTEDNKNVFQLIYGFPISIFDELNIKEANDILIKTCPKDVVRPTPGFGSFAEIKQLLTYPPEGRYRITINTEDYICLAQDQFLNDVIIDFYLTYLVENLPPQQKSKIHVFSTFFYRRLTTKPTKASRKSQPSELDPTLSPSQKRHARVKKWTKNVNIFDKDFVIVPINENAHWFLAIICFPGMLGCHTWDDKPYKLEVKSRKKKNVKTVNVGNVTLAIKQEKLAKAIPCDDPDLSDKDEAEGHDSEMESDDSEEAPPLSQNGQVPVSTPTSTSADNGGSERSTPPPTSTRASKEPRIPIKQPCILIFDSLSGASRCRVVATLRDYLTCEYKSRMGKERVFNKDIIKGACPKVPQQNNFTDCGLYLLQYVEQFFKDPIKDFRIPIKEIQNWFEEITVTKKREDIAILLKSLMREYGKDLRLVPDIAFPTLNGKIVERELEDEEEEEEMMEEEEDEEDGSFDMSNEMMLNSSKESLEPSSNDSEMKSEDAGSPIKPSSESVSGDFVTQPVVNPKPDLSEFPRHTNKDTLSILKAKRIVRHKPTDEPFSKKQRSEQD